MLRSNNKTTKVSLVEPCQDNWCHVKGTPVPTGEGYVYSGKDYQSLQFKSSLEPRKRQSGQ